MQKTIFITGASSGLGKATAKLFQSKGWNVIATMRNPENETELTKLENVTVLKLDVTNINQIQETINFVTAKHSVDVVLNNVGYGLIGPLETATDEQLVKQLDTNLLGTIRVTQAFIPYFRENKKGLFVSITSIAGLVGLPLTSVYNATKWALEGWSEGLSFELKELGIGIKTIAPGGIKTDFAGRSLETSSHEAYSKIEEKLYNSFNPDDFTSVEEIAENVYEAIIDESDTLRYIAGEDAKKTYQRRQEIDNETFRREMHQSYFGN